MRAQSLGITLHCLLVHGSCCVAYVCAATRHHLALPTSARVLLHGICMCSHLANTTLQCLPLHWSCSNAYMCSNLAKALLCIAYHCTGIAAMHLCAATWLKHYFALPTTALVLLHCIYVRSHLANALPCIAYWCTGLAALHVCPQSLG